MMQAEKDKLLELFEYEGRWCQDADAQNEHGDVVRFDDATAVSWDLVCGLCYLFGWKRASKLFGPMSRHLSGKPRPDGLRHFSGNENNEILSMTALLNFNDDPDMTYEVIMSKLHELPVWQGRRAVS